ncbi:MAG: leucine-rich repeat domain-containing protein [Lachnospiraceae bacterium]|nr:leucine-rich repeat domain-containing protein [Lachnospiraceae bacterium]
MDKKDFESLLNKYPGCVSDGKKLMAFLKDLYPDVPKAIINTLTIMADDGIISEMKTSPESSSLVSARLQKKLEDDYGLSQKIISQCFSLIPNNAKQTKSTISAYTHEKITGFIDTQPTFELRKEVPQKLDILQPKYNPKDFEIEQGVLKKYKGRSSVVVIPDSVTSIGKDAFEDCTGLTSVTIPDSVTSIGWGAFEGCTGLKRITIPDSVTSIGGYAFHNTLWYNKQPYGLVYAGKVAYKYKGTTPRRITIVLKEGTLGITDCAFENCFNSNELFCLNKSVTIPDSVTNIGHNAFSGCTSLTSITIPDSVESIGWWAFKGCWKLTIYCEAESKPIGWDSDWNPEHRPVVWGVKK